MDCPRCKYPAASNTTGCSSCGWKPGEHPSPTEELRQRIKEKFAAEQKK